MTHIRPYKPKQRSYTLPVPHPAYDEARATGSLFDPTGPGVRWTTDARAQAVNDLVVVVIDETATAQRNMASESSKQAEASANLERFLGLIAKLQSEYPDFDGVNALKLTNDSSFKGQDVAAEVTDSKRLSRRWFVRYCRTGTSC